MTIQPTFENFHQMEVPSQTDYTVYSFEYIFNTLTIGWLQFVGSLKFQVSLAKESYERDYILQNRPIILRSLLIVATLYIFNVVTGQRQYSVFEKRQCSQCSHGAKSKASLSQGKDSIQNAF